MDYQEHHRTIRRSIIGDVDDRMFKVSMDYEEIPKAGVSELGGGRALGVRNLSPTI
jgi:hypothetical protein